MLTSSTLGSGQQQSMKRMASVRLGLVGLRGDSWSGNWLSLLGQAEFGLAYKTVLIVRAIFFL